jgi:glycosyltransferase involved in cell wall biosynthesis
VWVDIWPRWQKNVIEIMSSVTKKESLKLSVVVPVYNEQDCVLRLYDALLRVCDEPGLPYEIIFVDDGSQDDTHRILQRLHGSDQRVKVVRFRKNYGQTAAMAAGFQYAQGEVIVSMDGDLQNDPVDIPRLVKRLGEGFDVVCGWRKNRQDKLWTRRVPSVVANWMISRITGVRIHDNGCSLKAYRASVIKNVTLYGEMHRFIPAMATLAGARITEVVVNHHPRRFGKSKYGLGRIWRVALDIITVKLISGFASRPGVWFGIPSVFFFALGLVELFAAGVYGGNDVEEWTVVSTVVCLCFLLSVHLLTMGIIGELALKMGDYRPQKTCEPTVTSL